MTRREVANATPAEQRSRRRADFYRKVHDERIVGMVAPEVDSRSVRPVDRAALIETCQEPPSGRFSQSPARCVRMTGSRVLERLAARDGIVLRMAVAKVLDRACVIPVSSM